MQVPAWAQLLTGLDIAAICLALGGVMALYWLLPADETEGGWQQACRHRVSQYLLTCFAALTLTSLAILLTRSVEASGEPLAKMPQVIPLMLRHTDFGHWWCVRMGMLVLLWLGWWHFDGLKRQPELYGLLLLLLCVVAYVRSTSGHAGDLGDWRLPVWMDWLHLLAAALWGGVVVAFVIALCQPLRQKPDAQRVAVLTRLSRLAGLGLGLALVTGVYNAWQRLGGWAPLWTTHYGHLLDIKILLVFLMALLGASNHFWHVPAARVAEANEPFFPSVAFLRLLQIARLETILILLILVVVAMLVSGVPPARLH